MWKPLPWTARAASGYPQRECFFCCTTSIILPPYNPHSAYEGRSSDTPQPPHAVSTSPSTSTISTGTPANWFCSNCQCQNVANQDGTPVEQYTRPMWDEAWNRDRSLLLRHTSPQTTIPTSASPSYRPKIPQTGANGKSTFTFCHTCRTNQVLTLNMLADYLPGEEDPEYAEKLRCLPEYETSLVSRYPPVCSDCAPEVQQRITERDQFARSWSLGKWLDLKKEVSNGDSVDPFHHSSPVPDTRPAQAIPVPPPSVVSPRRLWESVRSPIKEFVRLDSGSPLAMGFFVLTNTCLWMVYLWVLLWPNSAATKMHRKAKHIEEEPASVLNAAATIVWLLLLLGIFAACSKPDPLRRRIDRARARQLRVQPVGLGFWYATQCIILALRLAVFIVSLSSSLSPRLFMVALEWIESGTGKRGLELYQLAAVSMLVSEVGLTALATFQIGLRTPTPLQLVSRPIISDEVSSKMSARNDDALLLSLSLDDQATRPSLAFDAAPDNHHNPVSEKEVTIPRVDRDADGDAVMEDAATYVARRTSQSWEDESDQDPIHVGGQPASSWSSQLSQRAALKQPNLFNGSNQTPSSMRSGAARSSRYNDFQLGPQRFWEPQKPTGLEDVFVRAVSLHDKPQPSEHHKHNAGGSGKWSQWFGFS